MRESERVARAAERINAQRHRQANSVPPPWEPTENLPQPDVAPLPPNEAVDLAGKSGDEAAMGRRSALWEDAQAAMGRCRCAGCGVGSTCLVAAALGNMESHCTVEDPLEGVVMAGPPGDSAQEARIDAQIQRFPNIDSDGWVMGLDAPRGDNAALGDQDMALYVAETFLAQAREALEDASSKLEHAEQWLHDAMRHHPELWAFVDKIQAIDALTGTAFGKTVRLMRAIHGLLRAHQGGSEDG